MIPSSVILMSDGFLGNIGFLTPMPEPAVALSRVILAEIASVVGVTSASHLLVSDEAI